jgi:hypothetical protein
MNRYEKSKIPNLDALPPLIISNDKEISTITITTLKEANVYDNQISTAIINNDNMDPPA